MASISYETACSENCNWGVLAGIIPNECIYKWYVNNADQQWNWSKHSSFPSRSTP